jgi:hypothetical protein
VRQLISVANQVFRLDRLLTNVEVAPRVRLVTRTLGLLGK